MKTQLNILIADSQRLFSEGFSSLLRNMQGPQINILESITDANDIVQMVVDLDIDVLFMELNFTSPDSMEIISEVKTTNPSTKICVVSSYTDHKLVKKSFLSGADGFYSKKNSSIEILKCFTELELGNTFLSEGVHITPPQKANGEVHVNGNGAKSNHFQDRFLIQQKLTKREQEILQLITKALNNKEIADRLYISHQTVGVHRKNIMRKLNVKNTVNLIRFAIDHQLI